MRETVINCAIKGPGTSETVMSTGKKPRIESNHLFQGNSEIVIVHQNEEYNLRITRNGKLLLTK
jgi:hemin uptake protein HemP